MLWQHLFWFFGHPEVYIVALPFFGIITEVIPVFSRKPMFGYKGLVGATLAIAALSMSVWAHHMFATGQVLLPFFSFLSFLIAVPTGMKFFNWIGTMWRGQITLRDADAVRHRLPGHVPASAACPACCWPPRRSTSTSPTRYFVVAHFHYVLFGTIVFAVFAGIYFWFPKMTGRMLDERLGKVHFWLTFIGFHTTFLVQHWLGTEGMPRRYADYLPSDGFTTLNTISTIGAFILGVSTLPFLYNVLEVVQGRRGGRRSTTRGATATRWSGRPSCPPPLRNFDRMPRIRSERPAFDAKFPHLAAGAESDGRPARGRCPAADQRESTAAPPTRRTPPGTSTSGALRTQPAERHRTPPGARCPSPFPGATGQVRVRRSAPAGIRVAQRPGSAGAGLPGRREVGRRAV